MNTDKPRFPVYIVSKGRWKRKPTSNILEEMGIDYKIVVEKQEYDNYKKVIDIKKILILPQKYLNEYDTFWKRADDNKCGPGAARNFCWQHSMENGYKWHWVMDDNIESVERFNNNMKIKCVTGKPFHIIEEFVSRYENIAQAGMGYAIFCPSSDRRPPIRLNTRIYSCLLIRNDIPYRWRGRYNEDTDLSLRALKDGWVTVEFNAFLIGKRATQSMGGGNTEEFYAKEGTLNKSQMLVDMHPDVTVLTKKFNRWHHHVNYKPFKKNKLIRKKNLMIKNCINEYGMKLVKKGYELKHCHSIDEDREAIVSNDNGQKTLFKEYDYSIDDEWVDMPEYNNIVQQPPKIVATFKFKTQESYEIFKELIKKHIYNGEKPFDGMQRKESKTAWYPHKEKASRYEYI